MRTSYGILCFRKKNNRFEFLMVKRRCSYAFSIFTQGKYKKENINYIFNNITSEEKALIANYNYDLLYYTCFLRKRLDIKDPAEIRKYEKYKNKYESTFSEAELIKLLNGTTCISATWDFPKGTATKCENTLETAVREFEEETGLNSNNYTLYKNHNPLIIEFKDDIYYRYILYFAKCNNIIPATYRHYCEISEIKWFNSTQAKLLLRSVFIPFIPKIINISKKINKLKECLKQDCSKSQKKLNLNLHLTKTLKNLQI